MMVTKESSLILGGFKHGETNHLFPLHRKLLSFSDG
jgi:hypothetical protein